MLLMSLALPWEVIERIIEYASDNLDLLRSFCLTCRQLRHRSFSLILAQHVLLNSRDRASKFCDFLLKNTEHRPSIKSLSISPADFNPIPLVNTLPHLSTLLFIPAVYNGYGSQEPQPVIKIHPALLSCYHSFGKRIHTVSLNRISFQTSSDLFRLLLAFPKATTITCSKVFIKSPTSGASATGVVGIKLSKQLRLESLHVRSVHDKSCSL